MGVSKIQDEQEVFRWFEEGKTYQQMVDIYLEKYNIETTITMWANFRRRKGLDRRYAYDEQLIPWAMKLEHRHSYPILMLRKEARRRAGLKLPEGVDREVDAWIAGMDVNGTVLHYDPDTEQGWFYVPRRDGTDKDLIREPERRTGKSHVRKTTPGRVSA